MELLGILIKGIGYGVVLSILVGPILFSLIQASIEQGIRLGVSVGLGVWLSDLILMAIAYNSVAAIPEIPNFELYTGIIGGIVLGIFGLIMLFSPPPTISADKRISAKTYSGYFIQGFLVNTINPFAIIFWFTVTTAEVFTPQLNQFQAFMFLGGILGTIIFTDLLKVILAKKIKPYLKQSTILRLRQISGAALMIFGIILIGRVVF